MTMFDLTSQTRLKGKMDYELWFLEFISKKEEILEGGAKISKISLKNRQSGQENVAIAVSDVMGSGAALEVMNAMRPLTFAASYKILDVIFEWILEENRNAGKIKKAPWEFKRKIESISNSHSNLILPNLFETHPYMEKYLFQLYTNLLKFRNEIIHSHKFSVLGNNLRIETAEGGQTHILELSPRELGSFVKIVVAVANLLARELSFDPNIDRLLKYYIDRLTKIHGLAEFKQPAPIPIDVDLEVFEENKMFSADLKFVRQELSRIFPDVNILFNLKIIGLADGRPVMIWLLPFDSVPGGDRLELSPDAYVKYRVPLTE